MSWSDLVGQPLVSRLLQKAVAAGHTAHAYLFVGPAGVGKREAGRILAKALNCTAPPAPGDSCDQCRPCRLIDAGVHPDVLVVQRLSGKFIRVFQMVRRDPETREAGVAPVREFVSRRPLEARHQVVLVLDADQMNEETQNAFLKTLEEPPDYTRFVLTTANPEGLLPTVLSRTQAVNFPPAPVPVVAAVLEQEGMSPEQARLLAALSGGSVGRARSLGAEEGLAQRRQEARELLAGLGKLDDLGCLAKAEELEKRREELPEILELLLFWLRDALVCARSDRRDLVVAVDALPFLADLAVRLGPDRLMQMLETVLAARQAAIDRRNPNMRLVLDLMMLRLAGMAA